jgi:hypothetical protein
LKIRSSSKIWKIFRIPTRLSHRKQIRKPLKRRRLIPTTIFPRMDRLERALSQLRVIFLVISISPVKNVTLIVLRFQAILHRPSKLHKATALTKETTLNLQ